MYKPDGTLSRDETLRRYEPMVRRMAHQMIARLPASVELDDIVQNGMIGLMDALERFETGHGAQFETYAAQRVRGAMLDGLRQNDWMPRSVRKAQRRLDEALRGLEHRLGRAPTESEIASAMGLRLEEYHGLLQEARGAQLVHYEDFEGGGEDSGILGAAATDPSEDPLARIEDAEFRGALVAAIRKLPERERNVMGLYYEQELNLREIAEVLGVTESRVCQIHGQAIARLRASMGKR